MGATLISGVLALSCSVQDVTPLLGNASGEPYALAVSVSEGKGTISGAAQLTGQNRVEIVRVDDGSLLLRGPTFRDGEEGTWAVLRYSSSVNDYEMEWLMYDTYARDGGRSVATWAKGRCKTVGQAKENIQ